MAMDKRAAKQKAQVSVRTYRAKMKRQGLRLMQIWVPDIHAPGFWEEFRRQGEIVAAHDLTHPEEMAELEALQEGAFDSTSDDAGLY